MRFTHFFVDHPIFAAVISIVLVLIGGIAYESLPVAQYPEVAPPTVQITTKYPGASAEIVSQTVATPLEEQINGVENMLYMVSQATGDGNLTLTVTFKLGTNLDNAQVLTQNRVAIATPQLPQEVQRQGIITKKNSPDLMMVINMVSPDNSLDQLYISNYATLQIKDPIARIDGVGDVQIFGARDYSMRIWLDPDRLAELNLTADDVTSAVRGQNIQVSAGSLGAPPVKSPSAFEINVQTLGRLISPRQFEDIVIKSDGNGRVTRIRDVGHVELGAQNYNLDANLSGKTSAAIGIFQLPGSNALATADRVKAEMRELKLRFPAGLDYEIAYNPTDFIQQSIDEVERTIYEAVALVVIVIIIFLQTWRAAIIPIVAIPVALIGTFAVLAGLGFSLNNLTLFGLVLAIGIVVDDAIVVVENVERNMQDGLGPREAAHRTMDEVGTALVAIALVLCAVFVPAALVSGINGQFYRQFAVTIAASTVISMIVSLTLSPALCALLLKPHDTQRKPSALTYPIRKFFAGFNWGFDKLAAGYGGLTRRFIRFSALVLVVYAGLIGLTYYQFSRTPVGFIPEQDQGYLINAVQLPPGASLGRTEAVVEDLSSRIRKIDGVENTVAFAGLDGATLTNAPNAGAIFATLQPFATRVAKGLTIEGITGQMRQTVSQVEAARTLTLMPPPVRGIGQGGGFKLYVEDRRGRGIDALDQATSMLAARANQESGLSSVFTLFNTRTPTLFVDFDRVKAEMLGVPIGNVFNTLNTYLGSSYVNDFNYLGRTYQVYAQADSQFRKNTRDIAHLKTRNARGEMVPLGSVVTFRDITTAYRVPRNNLYPAAAVQGTAAPGFSSGQAIATMERLAQEVLPDGFSYEWTDLAYQEKLAGNTAIYVFLAAVVFVFLFLAAQYESWLLPLAVILIVPMCLLAAVTGVLIRGLSDDILVQIGLLVLVGLAAKNAILIVEFARQREEEGESRAQAAIQAAQTRLRPILMTSFAFILGVVPLVIAKGAGAEMRISLGTAVFSGMIGVTLFGLLFTPTFYTVCRSLARKPRPAATAAPEAGRAGARRPQEEPSPAE